MNQTLPSERGARTSLLDRVTFPTAWARTRSVAALRELIQICAVNPLLRSEVALDVEGIDDLRNFEEPALIVANHSSHLDTAVLLCTLPRSRRHRTAVAVPIGSPFGTFWRAAASALVFNTFPIQRRRGSDATLPRKLMADGWSIIIYPEGTRSQDGFPGQFQISSQWLALANQVPVIPVGLRGTYAAMPRGRRWPRPGRSRVAVRYGEPILPQQDISPHELAPRIATAISDLIAEDATSWWAVQRGKVRVDNVPPPGSWRRIWEQTAAPAQGGKAGRPKIWRS